jgi:hypothetical protein
MATMQSHTDKRALNRVRYYIHKKKKLKPWEPDRSPRNMTKMKHFAEVYTRETKFKLDKKLKRPTVKSIRFQIRTFMSAWQHKTNLTILMEVRDSTCPVSIPQRSPTPTYSLLRLLLTKIVHLNWAQRQDSSIDRGKSTHIPDYRELCPYAGAVMAIWRAEHPKMGPESSISYSLCNIARWQVYSQYFPCHGTDLDS